MLPQRLGGLALRRGGVSSPKRKSFSYSLGREPRVVLAWPAAGQAIFQLGERLGGLAKCPAAAGGRDEYVFVPPCFYCD